MRELEVPLLEGNNSAAVDLFDRDHAGKVLAAFGRAVGRLPENTPGTSKEQREFLRQSVVGLAEEDKVICVRLALFAEMMKGKSWVPATLKLVGGTEGIGVTFLEETFSATTAPPEHRLHQKAARAVLKALLPERGTEIRGHMRSRLELREASGYTRRPKDFGDLLRLLDNELRLVTPTDVEGHDSENDTRPAAAGRHYQLTHDYLVPSLRQWLTSKQRETRRGRAELRLAERAALWSAKPETRRLPAWYELLNIICFTRRKTWTEIQQKMMGAAARHHGLRWGILLALLVAAGITLREYMSAQRADIAASRVDAVLTAPADTVPYAIDNLDPFANRAVAILRNRLRDSDLGASQQLHALCALARFGRVEHEDLVSHVKAAANNEYSNIVSALRKSEKPAGTLLAQHAEQAEEKQDWRHKARLAIVALHLGDATLTEDMFGLRPDPIQRTVLIDTIPLWHGDIAELAPIAKSSNDSAFRSGICLGIGSIPDGELSAGEKKAWIPLLLGWHQQAADTGTCQSRSVAGPYSRCGWPKPRWDDGGRVV